jgi:hypothetical protein
LPFSHASEENFGGFPIGKHEGESEEVDVFSDGLKDDAAPNAVE